MDISRDIVARITPRMGDQKAIVITGPRQSGKTTLVKNLVENRGQPFLWLNCDDTEVRSLLTNPSSKKLRALIGRNKLVVIDEAQRVANIGLCIKLIIDSVKQVKVIATGSSALDLADRINEPLTGRKWEFLLLPFSYAEMTKANTLTGERGLLDHRLVYGYYPEMVLNPGDETERLVQLADSYLYKDLLTWEQIKKPERLEKLAQALAFQVGNEVSYHELGQLAGLDNETTERYVTLLEKAFVIYRLPSLSRNLRNELKKSRKIYFYDNGLRNALIRQFNPVNLRNDMGALWENFLATERLKKISNQGLLSNRYFWRTHAQQEIDYLEDSAGRLHAFEFKWNEKSSYKFPAAFQKAYKKSVCAVVNPANFEDFVM